MSAKSRPLFDPRFSERDNPEAKIWDVKPPQSLIDDLRAFTVKTGTPDLWRFHCHSKPPENSPPPRVIATNIDIPESLRASVGKAPCPLCSLRGPRYFYAMLGWWPDEKALRVIGHECGHKFWGVGFDVETRRFELEKDDDANLGFLIDNFRQVAPMRKTIEQIQPTARFLDRLRRRFFSVVSKKNIQTINRSLDSNFGRLGLYDEITTTFTDSRGNESRKQIPSLVEDIHLNGRQMLAIGNDSADIHLYRAEQNLKGLDLPSDDSFIDELGRLDMDGRKHAADNLKEAWKAIKEAVEVCTATQEFFASENLRAFARWASDHRAPVQLRIREDRLGRFDAAHRTHSMQIIPGSPELKIALPRVPILVWKESRRVT